MRKSVTKWLFGAALAVSPLFVAASAHADGIDACNNINISANAQCELLVEGGCTARCEEVQFRASCSAKLYAECGGQCNIQANAQCGFDCKADCSAKCTVDPGSFDCRAGCEANCGAKCDAYCAADANSADCRAHCDATCAGECDAGCTGTKPEASCDAKCEAACSGSCDAQANIDCQVKCQAESSAQCETELKGGCVAQCQKPDGALFCNGEYVDASDNLKNCLAYLEGILKIDVEGYAYADGNAECRDGQCTAEGEAGAGISCSASPVGSSPWGAGAVFGAAVVGAGVLAVRRHSRRRG
jgi:hypothetical protein